MHLLFSEVVLTLGQSRTVKKFLCAAKKKRSFQVFVAEGSKVSGSCSCKKRFANYNDYRLFSFRHDFTSKRCHSWGSCRHGQWWDHSSCWDEYGCTCCKKHAVPFVVVAGTHKLCLLYPNNPEVLLNDMRCPSELLSFGEFSDFVDFSIGSGASLLNIVNPAFDYVPPELVSLFVTEINSITKHALACSPLDNFSCPITAG
ncbi:hypothetical protein C1H46_037140 [Malus baccata]|uniref:Translation initiation factor eIF2B subunit beta n=1 Tax=Malus baccata TaxID=106549 RepID=A0A540KT11_MALBA|nr:hypothetical protein C1H46_037140 [Malus baccata]